MTHNRLGLEKSPYLLQHKDNLVWWYPWGDAAFAAAREQSKPIFLSVGYSTCYWCHVMEKDSFELSEVAKALNRDFICIKVDREERPDIDRLYMDVLVGLNGHGGWPMSMFLTPDGKPFWGGTFFWKKQLLSILDQLGTAWRERREEVIEAAQGITETVQAAEQRPLVEPGIVNEGIYRNLLCNYQEKFDERFGGFGKAPKFPAAESIRLLLRMAVMMREPSPLKMAEATLEGMARGGIYDHLGGGFSRYSVDAEWRVPHFEKMLYDNALLVVAYLEGYQIAKRSMYREVATETLEYLLREMQSAEGGFYSAQDAGEVGREGEFYVWRSAELRQKLAEGGFSGNEIADFCTFFEVSDAGNFEGEQNVLNAIGARDWRLRSAQHLRRAREFLRGERAKRVAPHRDDKLLTSWNGLAISAFAKGFQVLREPRYLQAAQQAAEFVLQRLRTPDGKLLHSFFDGQAGVPGMLEDYSYLIAGLLDLHQADLNERWVFAARDLQQLQDAAFRDPADGLYFLSTDLTLLARQKELFDNATPSGMGVTFSNLQLLTAHFPLDGFQERAEQLLTRVSGMLVDYGAGFARMMLGVYARLAPLSEVAIVEGSGRKADTLVAKLQAEFSPARVLALQRDGVRSALPIFQGRSAIDGKITVFRCRGHICDLPVVEGEVGF